MKDNVMCIPAIVLMVIETAALAFLICSWIKAKREERNG